MQTMRINRRGVIVSGAAAGLAGLAVQARAEIHNGGVDVTNWNGTYELSGSSASNAALMPPDKEPIVIRQDAPNGVDMDVTIGGERCTIQARTNGSQNRRRMSIKGVYVTVYATWVDGYGKNWEVHLTPDPLRPNVPYSVRQFLLTSFHTVIVQAAIHDPRNQVPLATFPDHAGKKGGSKVRDLVDARAVYMMPVGDSRV
jgi:hypothetical protein